MDDYILQFSGNIKKVRFWAWLLIIWFFAIILYTIIFLISQFEIKIFIAVALISLIVPFISTFRILQLMKCPKCGKSLGRDFAKYCTSCGTQLKKD